MQRHLNSCQGLSGTTEMFMQFRSIAYIQSTQEGTSTRNNWSRCLTYSPQTLSQLSKWFEFSIVSFFFSIFLKEQAGHGPSLYWVIPKPIFSINKNKLFVHTCHFSQFWWRINYVTDNILKRKSLTQNIVCISKIYIIIRTNQLSWYQKLGYFMVSP